MGARDSRADVLLVVMGAPHASEQTTTVFRLVESLLRRGARVVVWTCGYATLLTQQSLGMTKPRNMLAWDRDYPTTAAVVTGLLRSHPESLVWLVCRFCAAERGATDQIPQVRPSTPLGFGRQVGAAERTVFVGQV